MTLYHEPSKTFPNHLRQFLDELCSLLIALTAVGVRNDVIYHQISLMYNFYSVFTRLWLTDLKCSREETSTVEFAFYLENEEATTQSNSLIILYRYGYNIRQRSIFPEEFSAAHPLNQMEFLRTSFIFPRQTFKNNSKTCQKKYLSQFQPQNSFISTLEVEFFQECTKS